MAASTLDQNRPVTMNKLLAITIVSVYFVSQISAMHSSGEIYNFRQSDFLEKAARSKRDSETFSSNLDGTNNWPNVRPPTGKKLRSARNTDDEDCKIINAIELKTGVHTYAFNDSNEDLSLLWTGEHGQSILALTTLEYFFFASPSHVWISHDFGKTFEKIDAKLNEATIKADNGIFRHRKSFEKVLLVSYPEDGDPYATNLYKTQDGGLNFERIPIDFRPEGPIISNENNPDWLLAHAPNQNYKLWFSEDFGKNWRLVSENVIEYSWGTVLQKTENFIFMSVIDPDKRVDNRHASVGYTLFKTDPDGTKRTKIKDNIYNFGCQGKFLFAATDKEGTDEKNKTKVLHVSTDGGNSWNLAQVPGVFGDQFFSVLDMSEGMIILHVDDVGDTGFGKLYTSDADGLVFSLSLDKHLFPNGNTITDFYKVQSMRGVYLASQLDTADDSIHTMISFDRGGEWDYVDAPKGMTCEAGESPCKLQIHNRFSQMKDINVPSLPLSVSSAPGLILAHGNVADGLEVRDPDVFVTSDGGYNWTKALDGPHQYAITNFGGLIVAVSKTDDITDTVRFSYDEGHCWHSYQFTDEKLIITGLLPEPRSKSLNITIWGFSGTDRKWRVFTIDFSAVLTKKCDGNRDFITWFPHEKNGKKGCFLGVKESFKKVKPDSFCKIDTEFEIIPSKTKCSCAKVDYECDYGFYRNDESDECKMGSYIQPGNLEVCKGGKDKKIDTWGYRKIPGDVCEGGYSPKRSMEDLHKQCSPDQMETNYMVQQKHKSTVLVVSLLFIVVGILCISAYVIKITRPCKSKSNTTAYSYSELTQGEVEEEVLDVIPNANTYHDDSDEDMIA